MGNRGPARAHTWGAGASGKTTQGSAVRPLPALSITVFVIIRIIEAVIVIGVVIFVVIVLIV